MMGLTLSLFSWSNETYFAIVAKENNKYDVTDKSVPFSKPAIENWASYLNEKGCHSSATIINEDDSINCSGKTISFLDENFPDGTLGIKSLSNFNLPYNQLFNIDFFIDVKNVTGSLTFNNNSDLENIDGLYNLNSVGSINISNTSVVDLRPLSVIEEIGSLNLENIPAIDFEPLKNINITSSITTDLFEEGDLLPTNGTWCTDQTYFKLKKFYNKMEAAGSMLVMLKTMLDGHLIYTLNMILIESQVLIITVAQVLQK